MTAFFLYAVTDCRCKYALLFEYFARKTRREKPPKPPGLVPSFKCASCSTQCILFRPAPFLIFSFIEENTFLFQTCDLHSLHVSLGNSHMLAKGGQFQDRPVRRKKMPFLPYFPIQCEISLICLKI